MRIEEFRDIRRPQSEWEPFMRRLRGEVRLHRRRTLMGWAAAAVLAASLGAALVVGVVRGGRTEPLVRADVPTRDEPVFRPSSGVALTPGGGVVIVTREDRHEPA